MTLRDLFDDDMEYEFEMKTFNEYEEEAMNTAVYDGEVIYPTLGLLSEAGEVADKIKKMMRDEDIDLGFDMSEEQRKAVALEVSDCLWYVTALASDLGYSLEDIANMNIEKLRDRKDRNAIHGSGDER
jgi:NTP pyrophosphatase (non-canonical NTP hydrolase)